ncbi:hypothetical protein [Pedobacter antarcticus]|uniref:hypothetical protein n=1 Tax=Pedobacter antarcticus TaxID=34086 RepID=UPI003977B79F
MVFVLTLTAGGKANLLMKQAIHFKPHTVVIVNENQYLTLKAALSSHLLWPTI